MFLFADWKGSVSPRHCNLRRATLQGLQLAFEDQFGRELTTDPPRFVLDFLGRPPNHWSMSHRQYRDRRWWVDRDETLTRRQLWERAAGALAGLCYGRGIISDAASNWIPFATWLPPDDPGGPEERTAEGYDVHDVGLHHHYEVDKLVGGAVRDLGGGMSVEL